jgi:hypothetical protein
MEGKEKHKHRLKGLFSKEKKTSNDDDLNSFLHGPSDQLNFPAPAPTSVSHPLPRLAKIDTNSARRWPTAAEVENARAARGKSASPSRSRKGLVVRFTDEKPEIIGEGGELAEDPTISLRNRANTHPPYARTLESRKATGISSETEDNFRPAQIQRTQTGYESISDASRRPQDAQEAPYIQDEHTNGDRKSFAEKVKEDMRAGEGKALVHATLDASNVIDQRIQSLENPGSSATEVGALLDELEINTLKNAHTDAHLPPPSVLPALSSPKPLRHSIPDLKSISTDSASHNTSRKSTANTLVESPVPISRASSINTTHDSPKPISRTSTLTIQEATVALGDEALREFSTRVTHLFTLFRLSSEAFQPLSKFTIEDFMKAASWWFLKGRLNLETTIRDRPTSPQAQQMSFLIRQQAYADLAKALWIIEQVIPQTFNILPVDSSSNPGLNEVMGMQHSIMVNMRKLTMSMKRNNFLPPEDAPLPQGLDPSIWTNDEGNFSLLASQRQGVSMTTSEAMPFGDSNKYFYFSRMFAKGTLIEEAISQQFKCPVLLSLGRDQKAKVLSMIVTNQSGTFRICVQGDRNKGPTWDHVVWQTKTNTIDVKLPRGFMLRIECPQNDFRTFAGIHDYEMRTHADLKQRQDEVLVFDSILKSFQYFGNSSFPKEPQSYCQLSVFKKTFIEKAAGGARPMHRGFRIALVTHPSNKNLRGISQDLPSTLPTQLGFLRGEGGLPAFLLKIDDGKQKYTMVFTFEEASKRSLLHARLTGTFLDAQESIVAEASVKSFALVEHRAGEKEFKCLKELSWQNVRVINVEQGDVQSSECVLSQNLRMVLDFKGGSLTDRVNVSTGELKIRLDVSSPNELKILRQPQLDMTMSILETQLSQEKLSALADVLSAMAKSDTSRTYIFPSLKELHLFQAALTGFSVIFDGMATSLNIARRRMVVPIYKKWEAVSTRIQVVKREKIVQLLAFFENFSHGDCMNFTLKSTDVFESSTKSGKFLLRIVDAKFSLPKGHEDPDAGVEKRFVCLDMPEYPGEHDDITIVFDEEEGT